METSSTNTNSIINLQFIEKLKEGFDEIDGLEDQDYITLSANSVISLLRQQINENKISLKKLASDYIETHSEDTWSTSTIFGLLEAYLQYVSNESIEPEKAWYLSSRGGLCWPLDTKHIHSLREIIYELDGEGFDRWLFTNSLKYNCNF